MFSSNELDNLLSKIEEPLVRQSVEVIIDRMFKAETSEEADQYKVILGMFLKSNTPNILNKAHVELLEKTDITINVEEHLKDILAENGILYFGPLPQDILTKAHVRKKKKDTGGPYG